MHHLKGADKKAFTKEVQMVFQDPYSSLDPRMKVGDIIAEGMYAHGMAENSEQCQEKVKELLRIVGFRKNTSIAMCTNSQGPATKDRDCQGACG